MGRRNPGVVYGLSNILDNATDFAESQVTIEACWTPHEVFIEIRDDGPGYAPEILLRVGEPYVTTRSAAERTEASEEGGSGWVWAVHRQDSDRAFGRRIDPDERRAARHGRHRADRLAASCV